MCFFLKILWLFWTLPVLLQRWFSTCLVSVHKLTPRENRERSESGNILKSSEKTQYLMNTLYIVYCVKGPGVYIVCDVSTWIGIYWISFHKRQRDLFLFIWYLSIYPQNISIGRNISKVFWPRYLRKMWKVGSFLSCLSFDLRLVFL